jgi:predicted amidohydrolase YtcJ
MLICNAAITPGSHADVRVANGHIAAIAPSLERQPGEDIVDARGCALIPGLHDHHMHLLALASALQSLDCNGTHEALALQLAARCREKPAEIRGINYHPGEQDAVDRHWLDGICPAIPVRIQHQSGRLWILNSAALARIDTTAEFPEGAELDNHGELTGRFYHADDWLRDNLPRELPNLSDVSRKLAACGVTGLTDAGPDNDDRTAHLLMDAQARGELLQNILLMGRADLSHFNEPMLKRGPQKIYLKESHLPDLESLCEEIRHSHRKLRPVAFHCVTRVELQVALSALRETGADAGDRIEHASVASDDALEQIAELGITVVTQPHFIAERGDRYRAQVDADDQPLLYRAQGFLHSGIALAGGTDAPYGHYDPWRSMLAATERRSHSGHVMGIEERVTPMQALTLYLGDSLDPGRRLRELSVGQPADLCLLDTGWPLMLANLSSEHVYRVWRGGELIFGR